ncbi:MAG: NADH-quinone oxidoreductase subunit K [Thiotrichaceae bacterium]
MSLILNLAISLIVSTGVWLLLSRDMFRIVVGLAVLGGAVNLIVFMSGRPGSLIPPVIPANAEQLAAGFANPLPQALVLTAIVIGFALLCFALVLAARLSRDHGHADLSQQQAAEPQQVGETPYKPAVLEDMK